MNHTSNNCLLPTTYWGPIQYYTKFLNHNKIFIEVWETYPKQSYRNRMHIYGPNGMQSLQVPVKKASQSKVLLKDVQIAYDTNWQKNHLRSIDAAYKSSPYFDYYFDDILPLYEKKQKYLLDLNLEILDLSAEMIDMDVEVSQTRDYMPEFDGTDYRNAIHPKENKVQPDKLFAPKSYMQGFEQRHGFIPNLSILDLIFNVGPESSLILKQSMINERSNG